MALVGVGDEAAFDVRLRSAAASSFVVGVGFFCDCDCLQLACRCVAIDDADATDAADESLQNDRWPNVSPQLVRPEATCSSCASPLELEGWLC